MRKIFVLLLLLSFCSFAYASTMMDLNISPTVRIGEKLTIAGDANASNELCKFVIYDLNGVPIERLSDERTFNDNSFYSERTITEPPYYRGDDYNVVVTCGTGQDDLTFSVEQPLSLAHPIQQGWSYYFETENVNALMMFFSFIILILGAILFFAFVIKQGRSYAS